MEWYIKVLKNYANFEGRARRKEYWMYILVNLGILIVSMNVGYLFMAFNTIVGMAFLVLVALYLLAIIIPTIAVSVRRLHDLNMSGILVIMRFIPLLSYVFLILTMIDGTRGPNRYGPSPKYDFYTPPVRYVEYSNQQFNIK